MYRAAGAQGGRRGAASGRGTPERGAGQPGHAKKDDVVDAEFRTS